MFHPRKSTDKAINKEMHRIIGEIQLREYGTFLDCYGKRLQEMSDSLPNTSHVRTTVVALENDSFEDVSIIQLTQSDNKLLSRILASLGSMCEELNLLSNEALDNYYISLVFFGEGLIRDKKLVVPPISKLTDTLQRLSFFIDRSQDVIVLTIRQICAILGKNLYSASAGSSFPESLDYLAELLVCLLTLDCVCENLLKNQWESYHKKVRALLHNPSKFDVPLDDLSMLEKCLSEIGRKVLSGNIFHLILVKCIDEGLAIIMKNSSINHEFTIYINQILSELEKDVENLSYTKLWLQVNAMFVLNYTCFGNLDKKMFKRLLDINKKVSTCTIIGHVLWHPEKFLMKHIPNIENNPDIKAITNNRILLLIARVNNLPKETNLVCTDAYNWLCEIRAAGKSDLSKLNGRQLNDYAELFVDGMKIIKKISETVKWITNTHADEERPMAKSVYLALCRLIEVLKSMQNIFHENLVQIVYIIQFVCHHLTFKALTLLLRLKKSFTQEKSYKEQQLDVLSALSVAERALKGTNSRKRILVAKLALSSSGVSHDTLSDLRYVINRLEVICSIHSLIRKLCNCSFLYWHIVLLPVYFTKLVDGRVDLSKFCLFLDSLSDCVDTVGKMVETSVEKSINNNMLVPLNQQVETNLRLQTHLHLQLPPVNPFRNPPINTFTHLVPIQFGTRYLHIKGEVEHYLSTMFYNLTTVVLHDWRIYGEMRRLATLQYGLTTVEDSLPTQTLDQGIDVLEIMRNIHIFVGNYSYNLNNQVFIETSSNNKHLNTISISHVANSIRTHGIGIMNTTVNFTYQFLQNQFYIFSQFMYDEQIKSRLLKDLRFFVEHKTELNQMYPYDRAEKFNIGIKRLGLNAEGLSFLDLFRKLITHIGNAMGYIRMVRSGGRRCLADATCFVPDLKAVDQLTEITEHEGLQKVSKKTIQSFKDEINNLIENFEEATEYFKLLINVFTIVFRDPQNVHLRNFHIIIPPLSINFIEHILISKERLSKKNRDGAAFTDDGFAIGLAYIVELLNQNSQLNSLHWFQSVKAKHLRDRKNLEEQKTAASREDVKLQQTLALTEKRLNSFEKEFQLLFYNFNSARVFFQS